MIRVLAEPRPTGVAGAVLDGGAAGPNCGRLLSVAELQRALQAARRTPPLNAPPQVSPTAPVPAVSTPAVPTVATATRPTKGSRGVPRPEPARRFVAVIGAHGGAGASTVALALADAAAAAGRRVHLVSCGRPGSCGLLAAASEELGIDPNGLWRTGRRSRRITVDRQLRQATDAESADPAGWPVLPTTVDGDPLMIVDAQAGAAHDLRWLASAAAVVLVCRVSVPGVQHAEQLLGSLVDTELLPGGAIGDGGSRPVLVAAVGAGRWPGAVSSATGPLLRRLRASGQVISVPLDRRLVITGPTSSALPRGVAGAGHALLRQLEAADTDVSGDMTVVGFGTGPPIPQRTPMLPARADLRVCDGAR